MAGPTTCPACAKQNRVPAAATGKPTCGACGAPLAWIVDATEDTFDAAVDTAAPVLVDLWAPWCGPCRMVAPVLEEVARERAGRLKIVKVNVDDSPAVAARYQVQGIPTLLLLQRAELVARQVGAVPAATLTRWLDTHVAASPASRTDTPR